MSSKINLLGIVKDHIATLKDFNTGRYSGIDILTLFGLPLIISITLGFLGVGINKDVVNVLITALSVFAGLLFNLLLLIYDIVQKSQDPPGGASKLQRHFLKEIYANISFCILVSIVAILALVAQSFERKVLQMILPLIIYFLLATFVVTLLMVLKRVHVLLSKEFSDRE